ncbi:MAG: lamin tail domain-containing protein [Myxococcales bacterium]|nr:lamin tail domain-containing protein [Myxococcales bacterium]
MVACGDDGGSTSPDAPVADAGVDGGDAMTDAMPDGMQSSTVQCPTPLAAPTEGDCDVVDGAGTAVVVRGNVLGLGTTYLDGAVVYDGNLITYVGCDPATAPGFATATVITCKGAAISPGLVNAHDHITYDNRAPLASTVAHDPRRYGHRNEWRDAWPTPPNQYGNTASNTDGVRWNELRQVFSGTTSIVGSGHADGMARNLDDVAAPEFALGFSPLNYEVFMLGDSSGANAHAIPASCGWNYQSTEIEVSAQHALVSHTSEGIDDRSRAEFQCQRTSFGGGRDFVEKNTAHVHVVAANAADYYDMARDRSALLWSPRSNISLFGNTSQAQVLARLGGTVAVGTDWTYTGSATQLRELACVDEFNSTYLDGAFTDEDMWRMATINGAIASRADDLIGSLEVGKLADLAVFHADPGETYRAIIAGGDADVALVGRDGDVLYGEDDVVAALDAGCETLTVCTKARRVCAQREFNQTYAVLAPRVPLAYPAIICAPPADEPTCLPTRAGEYDGVVAGDQDGDGVVDGSDNCPRVFNPIRPMDHGAQADVDADGVGDACDPTPVGTDLDGDGTTNATDVCPFLSDDQTDGDGDSKGDACDFCPAVANPDSVCPAVTVPTTIYDIKDGTTPIGTTARIVGALVTGKGSNGFFVQVKEGDAGYLGPDHSGLFVFTAAGSPFLAMVNVGNRVDVDGRVALFSGQLELDMVLAVTATSTVEAAPTPIDVTAAEIATGGPRAATLESVIVRIGAVVTVTAVDAAFGEFTVMAAAGGSVVVDDFLFAVTPPPTVGLQYGSVTGVLAFRNMASKIEIRSAADLGPAVLDLSAFGPAQSFVAVGGTSVPTFPTMLTVTLNQPAPAATGVTITSSNNAAARVPGDAVTVPMGATSFTVPVTSTAAGTATLTASLTVMPGVSLTATVRALTDADVRVLASLTPPTALVAPSGMVTFTVGLDVPAPTGGTVVTLATTAGAVPATVTVLANQQTATFAFTAPAADATVTVSATLGATTLTSMVSVVAATGGLVINEVDYDQTVNPDSTEYVELYNAGTSTVNLADYGLIFVNGNGTPAPYRTLALAPAGTLAPGGYLLIGAAAVTGGGTKFTPPVGAGNDQWPATDAIQNGGTAVAPPGDGIVLVNTATMTVVDKLAYEGPVTVTLTGYGSVNLVEMTLTTAADPGAGAMARLPNGVDTDNAAVDWGNTANPTPGAANAP